MTLVFPDNKGGEGGGASGPMTQLRYKRGTTQVITPDVAQTYIYNELDYDVRGDFNPATGVFTAPDSGSYVISAGIASLDTWTLGEVCTLELHVNGALIDYIDKRECETTGTAGFALSGTANVQLTQGDAVTIQIYHNRGANLNTLANGPSMADGNFNYFEVTQVVNTTNTSQNSAALVSNVNTLVDHDGVNIKAVKQPSDLSGTLDSNILYFITGHIDFTGTGIQIEVPAGGLTFDGHSFDLSSLGCGDPNYTLFTSPVGGSGNIVGRNCAFSISGTNSQVYDVTDSDGSHTIELTAVNYVFCNSLGTINGYRQVLESGTGRFLTTPELTFDGNMNGVRISTSIARALDPLPTALFKAGASLSFSGRFITDINCDLPATGALLDFSDSNIFNDESLIIDGAYITRSGVIDGNDTTIFPNIDDESVKSKWSNNTGLPNTKKYLKAACTTEIETVINAVDTYEPLLGTFTVEKGVHFSMPSNGEFQLLSGNGVYQVVCDLVLDCTQNNVIDVRVTKSSDGGTTWPTVVNHIRRQVNGLVGGRDVAFFPINFLADIRKNERIRIEVENKTGTSNITMELDSYIIITEV